MAKYPFASEAADYIKLLDLRMENLANPELKPILDRAENRIKNALDTNPPKVSYIMRKDEVEIPSFPVAVMMAAGTQNDYIKKRYALAEAIRVYNLLQNDDEKKVLEVAESFRWNIKATEALKNPGNYDFMLHFADYLENTRSFHETEWKLINRSMRDGWVQIRKKEVARLLQEEVRKHIEKKLEVDIRPMLPENVVERIGNLVQAYASKIVKTEFEELPKTVVNAAFPPCIRELRESATAGRHLSHVGRFALTSFLLRVGVPPREVVDLFRSSADFNERMTKYQVEHISGSRGSRTMYIPPKCDTLRTHGVCPGMDETCRRVHHPLSYYRRRIKTTKNAASADQA